MNFPVTTKSSKTTQTPGTMAKKQKHVHWTSNVCGLTEKKNN